MQKFSIFYFFRLLKRKEIIFLFINHNNQRKDIITGLLHCFNYIDEYTNEFNQKLWNDNIYNYKRINNIINTFCFCFVFNFLIAFNLLLCNVPLRIIPPQLHLRNTTFSFRETHILIKHYYDLQYIPELYVKLNITPQYIQSF
jgi:hypothetical protein